MKLVGLVFKTRDEDVETILEFLQERAKIIYIRVASPNDILLIERIPGEKGAKNRYDQIDE